MKLKDAPIKELELPISMKKEKMITILAYLGSIGEFLLRTQGKKSPEAYWKVWKDLNLIRLKHDFEFYAAFCIKIQDKDSKKPVPFILRKAQRKLLYRLERMRLKGKPIRIILLKARQWGGSTLVQVYMSWIQNMHKKNWHAAIIADVEEQARNIRAMYSRLAKNYPAELGSITLKPFEGSPKNKVIEERNCILGVGSAQKPDSLRSFDFAMTHMSEVGFWKSTAQRSAEDLVQSVRATVPDVPYSMAVLESTAKGVGNFFHREWQSAVRGTSSYEPVFVAWWEVERYQRDIYDLEQFIKEMTDYDKFLWELGATLEGINWYKYTQSSENYDPWRMKSEFPSTADEAFQSSGRRVFAPAYVHRARKLCGKPLLVGDLFGDSMKGKEALKNIRFEELNHGSLSIWAMPDLEQKIKYRYAIFGDIGGRTDKADWSVLRVIDRYWMLEGGVPETVATWRGHLDQDLFAWKAAQLAQFYGNALLALETNSLNVNTEGEHFLTVLDEIAPYYPNLFVRNDPEKIRQGLPVRYGFHTNKRTKTLIIDTLNGAIRDELYIERDNRACDEMDYYEVKENGTLGAVKGEHDDLVMATAGVVWMALSHMPLPVPIKPGQKNSSNIEPSSEAVF